ncbi:MULTISPECIES: putative sulfate exporter family transporter [Clostridium]|uniref:Putative sulfate exporter family transporter n=1 Tax=Clostridium senegalense TaxID=1465809 RepID=A0A6M0H5R1_9CLOT|nr:MULTISPECIES: putative sulfate exporter family transporter [Clostridium]NEU05989.1 putative sulfate exporter family transporter [Clostridium senegalense]
MNKRFNNFIDKGFEILPGLLISIIVAYISIALSKFLPKLGASSISIFLGMALGNTCLHKKSFQKGYKFAETDLLAYSIVLLGGTLSVSTILNLGLSGIAFIVCQMSVTIFAALMIGKKLGFSDNFRFLMASGNAVCGSSAIGATAPAINATDDEKGISIAIVNVTGVILMISLPLISGLLYNHETFKTSAMIGGILQSVGQVVASGAMVNDSVKDLSSIFKIVRIILLVVVVLFLETLKNKKTNKDNNINPKKKKFNIPWYVIGFFITCALFSFNIIPVSLSKSFKVLSNNLEIIALAAIGLRVNFKELIKHGKSVSLYGLFIGIIQILSAITLIGIFL